MRNGDIKICTPEDTSLVKYVGVDEKADSKHSSRETPSIKSIDEEEVVFSDGECHEMSEDEEEIKVHRIPLVSSTRHLSAKKFISVSSPCVSTATCKLLASSCVSVILV